jgi:predicted flap endonuclease-1-like 5' DNA nuclease
MIYLITQMLLCIALALITGGAVGWLLHRSRHADRISELRQTIGQQHAQVQQARTDVSMITQDFDELKSRAQTEIDALRQDNKRLPGLDQNLERSQLLVRQLMQKHEAQLRDLTQEKEQLAVKLSVMQDREASSTKVRAELESTRSQLAELRSSAAVAAPVSTPVAADTAALASALTAASSAATPSAPAAAKTAATTAVTAPDTDFAPVTIADDVMGNDSPSDQMSASETPAGKAPASPASSASSEALNVASSSAHRSSWASARLPDVSTAAGSTETESDSAALMRSMGLEFDHDEDETADMSDEVSTVGPMGGRMDEPDVGPDDAPAAPETDEYLVAREDMGDPAGVAQSEAVHDSAAPDAVVRAATAQAEAVPGDERLAIGEVEFEDEASDDFNNDTLTEYDSDVEQLFDAVDRRDDLQQIFGIGPVTERALNELGITSYSQLADLKRHDIETIADALQIFPGRIERDDWVGNARRQLEDVLEEL